MNREVKAASKEGWKPPADSFELQQELFRKHGQDSYTEAIDRRWRRLGKMIEAGARIDDGRLGS